MAKHLIAGGPIEPGGSSSSTTLPGGAPTPIEMPLSVATLSRTGESRCVWHIDGLEVGGSKAVKHLRCVPTMFGRCPVVRQLVGTTLGVLRHLVWTTLAPAERDHLVGGLPGSVS